MKCSGTIIALAVASFLATTRFEARAFLVHQSMIHRHTSIFQARPFRSQDHAGFVDALKASSRGDDIDSRDTSLTDRIRQSAGKLALFGGVGFLYWYWMVLGAYAASEGLPGIPPFLPLTPGWPPSMEDLQPALEDSAHFFYLADLLQTDAPPVQPLRLALFNFAEAWIFAYLPALWSDPKRLPRPLLLVLWLVLGINLTNAFLAPYLFVTEANAAISPPATSESSLTKLQKNPTISGLFGAVAVAVTGTALFTTVTLGTDADWAQMKDLIQTDRTYLAFVVDLCLFSVFQPLILERARRQASSSSPPLSATWDAFPFVGLVVWLLESSSVSPDEDTLKR